LSPAILPASFERPTGTNQNISRKGAKAAKNKKFAARNLKFETILNDQKKETVSSDESQGMSDFPLNTLPSILVSVRINVALGNG